MPLPIEELRTIAAGIAYKVMPTLTMMVDYKHIFYSLVPSISNQMAPIYPGSMGTANGPGFGWKDVDVIAVGCGIAGLSAAATALAAPRVIVTSLFALVREQPSADAAPVSDLVAGNLIGVSGKREMDQAEYEALAAAQSVRKRVYIRAALESLEYVRRSGRVPGLIASLGGLLSFAFSSRIDLPDAVPPPRPLPKIALRIDGDRILATGLEAGGEGRG